MEEVPANTAPLLLGSIDSHEVGKLTITTPTRRSITGEHPIFEKNTKASERPQGAKRISAMLTTAEVTKTAKEAEFLFQNTRALLQPVPKTRRATLPPPAAPKVALRPHMGRFASMPELLVDKSDPELVVVPPVVQEDEETDEEEETEEETVEESTVVEESVIEESEEPEAEEEEEEEIVPVVPQVKERDTVQTDKNGTKWVLNSRIFMAFNLPGCEQEPNETDYDQLAQTTQRYYQAHLTKKFPDTFESIEVSKKTSLFEQDGVPRKAGMDSDVTYQVYIEWDIETQFQDTDKGPNCHQVTQSLVKKANLHKYLCKDVAGLRKTPFAKADAVFTRQISTITQVQ